MAAHPARPTRRTALTALAGGVGGTAALWALRAFSSPVTSPAASTAVPQRPDDLAMHLARRLTFGATPATVEEVRALGPSAWLERQLDPEAIAEDPALVDALTHLPTLHLDPGELAQRIRTQERERREAQEAAAAAGEPPPSREPLAVLRGEVLEPARDVVLGTLLRQTFSRRQLLELVVDCWSNHFNVHLADGPVRFVKVIDDRDVIRRHAFGRFDELLVASATSPAMLLYLDQATSNGDDPNENYARELLELHTVGVDGGYDETDVATVARVLTGWSIDRDTGSFRFFPRRHAVGPASVLGLDLPGRRGPAAVQDGEELLLHLAHQPATARRVAQKLARRFIGEDVPEGLIDGAAATYLAHDTAIVPVLEHLLTSEPFQHAPLKLRRPLELTVGALRGLRWPVPDLTDPPTAVRLRALHGHLEAMGQAPFGWPAPNGYPDADGAWRSTSGLLARWNLAQALTGTTAAAADPGSTDEAAGGRRPGRPRPEQLPLATGSPLLALDEEPAAAVDALAEALHPWGLDDASRAVVVAAASGSATPARTAAALLLDVPTFHYR